MGCMMAIPQSIIKVCGFAQPMSRKKGSTAISINFRGISGGQAPVTTTQTIDLHSYHYFGLTIIFIMMRVRRWGENNERILIETVYNFRKTYHNGSCCSSLFSFCTLNNEDICCSHTLHRHRLEG